MEKKIAKRIAKVSEMVANRNSKNACIGIYFQPKTPKKLQK